MRKIDLFGIFTAGLLLTSCLGDGNTGLTLASQPGVVEVEPTKVIYMKGNVVITSDDLQKENLSNGECVLVDYSVDFGSSGSSGDSEQPIVAVIKPIIPVDNWPLTNVLTDTVLPINQEFLISTLQKKCAYIKGQFFLFAEASGHTTTQVDTFALSYNPAQNIVPDKDGKRIYDFYLRAAVKDNAGTGTGSSMILPNAFNIEHFVDSVGNKGEEPVYFRVNYASSFNKDTTQVYWKASDTFTIPDKDGNL